MNTLLVSLAPVAIIAFYVWFRDKYEREPVRMVLLAMLAGILIVFPIMTVESLIASIGYGLQGLADAAWQAFSVAAFTEELFIYNFILMTGIEWLWIVFVGFVVYLYAMGLKKMKALLVNSYYRTDYELLNRKFNPGS